MFSGQVPVASTQAPEIFVQVSPSVTRSGLLVEGVYLCKRAVKFSDTAFVASFDSFPCLTGALSCGFKSSCIEEEEDLNYQQVQWDS